MRTPSVAALMFVGWAFVFLAPTAKADCPHGGSKFDHPHCNGGGGAEVVDLVVTDANGVFVGTVVSATTNAVARVARLTTDGRVYMIGVERDRLVGDGLAFGTLNCTGPAFVAGGPSLLLPRAGIGGPGQEIFVERAGAATVIFFRRSQWQGDTCAPTSQENTSGRPADSEIQLNVTAPFNVE